MTTAGPSAADARRETARARAGARRRPSLPERLYAARERKGVDLYRAERDTKIRARYLAALERGDYQELPGAVYTKGFLRNYALYLGPRPRRDPRPVAARARREARDAPPVISVPRPLAAPRQGLTFSPFIVVLALMTIGVLAFGAYLGVQLLRFAKPPTIAVTDPPTAVIEVDDAATSYTLRGVDHPGRRPSSIDDARPRPVQRDGRATGRWSADGRPAPRPQPVRRQRVDPDTGKHSEETIRIFITVPFLTDRGADARRSTNRRRARPSRTGRSRSRAGHERASRRGHRGLHAARRDRAGGRAPRRRAPPATPAPSPASIADDGTYSTPFELTAGHWAHHRHRDQRRGQDHVPDPQRHRGLPGRHRRRDRSRAAGPGSRSGSTARCPTMTGAAGRVYAPGKVLTFTAKDRSRSGPASPARPTSRSTASTSGTCPSWATPRRGCSRRPTSPSGPTGADRRWHVACQTEDARGDLAGRLQRRACARLASRWPPPNRARAGWSPMRSPRSPGSSGYFLGAVVSYSNDAKQRPPRASRRTLLETHGAVSAAGRARDGRGRARRGCGADLGVGGHRRGRARTAGRPQKPVGLVYVAVADGWRQRRPALPVDRRPRREHRGRARRPPSSLPARAGRAAAAVGGA